MVLPLLFWFILFFELTLMESNISRRNQSKSTYYSNYLNLVNNTLMANVIGQFRFTFVNGLDSINRRFHENTVQVFIHYPDYLEVEEYDLTPKTLTRSNAEFGKGEAKVKNIPRAKEWGMSNATLWQIPSFHPRNRLKQKCVEAAVESGRSTQQFYNDRNQSLTPFYIMKVEKGFIHDTGIVGLEYGYIQGHEGCETLFKFIGRKWYQSCQKTLKKQKKKWSSMWDMKQINYPRHSFQIADSTYFGCENEGKIKYLPRKFKQVFVLSGNWDANYHHFLTDNLIKLIRYYDFLQSNPQIMIHIRASEKFEKKQRYFNGGIELRKRLFKILNIDLTRIVNGSVIADEVYLPRTTVCNMPTSHALEIRALAKKLLLLAFQKEMIVCRSFFNLPLDKVHMMSFYGTGGTYDLMRECLRNQSQSSPSYLNTRTIKSQKPSLILQHRHCETAEACLKTWREWPLDTFEEVKSAFETVYRRSHNIVAMTSTNTSTFGCYDCQIREYAAADVVVGIHGAGMTNIMFMRPGSLLVEIVGKFDGRMLPICGYHGPFATIFGVHHYIYYYDWKGNEPLNPLRIAKESWQFYSDLKSQKPSTY